LSNGNLGSCNITMSEEGLSKEAQGIMEKWNDGIMESRNSFGLQVAGYTS
jgi:hypothetical protein